MGAALLGAGVPAAHSLIAAARERLTALQASDGGWRSVDGPAADAHVTPDALRVLCAGASAMIPRLARDMRRRHDAA